MNLFIAEKLLTNQEIASNRHIRSDDLSLASRSKKDYLLPPSTLYTPPCALTSSLALDFVAQ